MPRPVEGTSRYMAGMDGLRALAVLAVIAYHLNVGWAPGGLLGVGVFFVLSGYLITNLLLGEWERHGHIRFKNFWYRRARRLLPALFIMLAVVISFVTLFDPGQVVPLRGDALAAVLYFSNWWYIFHHVSYFAKFGPPSPLTHLWSLAVEEQFYLVWPLALALGLRFIRKKSILTSLTVAAACASALAMALIYQPGHDPSRVYYGTDTRAFGLLIGAALAMVWPSSRVKPENHQRAPWFLEVLGAVGLAVVLLMFWKTNEYQTFLYRGGMAVLSLATAAVLASVVHPGSRLGKGLGWGPLRWLGVRSYGIYLWHYPVIVLTTPRLDAGTFDPVRAGIQVGASVALAALSWRFVEEPIRQGAIGRIVERWRERHALRWSTWVGGLAFLAVLSLSIGGLGGWVEATPVSIIPTPSSTAPSAPPIPSTSAAPPPSSGASAPPSSTVPGPLSGAEVTTIGDSVMLDAEPYLQKMLPGINVSAHVGRQWWQTPPLIAQMRRAHRLGQLVVIELGNNSPYTKQQFVALLRDLGPVKHIFLINTRVPMPWQNVVNTTLQEVASTYPHTTLINWYQYSANHPAWFYPDGVHLVPTGAKAYAQMIVNAVTPYLSPNVRTQKAPSS